MLYIEGVYKIGKFLDLGKINFGYGSATRRGRRWRIIKHSTSKISRSTADEEDRRGGNTTITTAMSTKSGGNFQ